MRPCKKVLGLANSLKPINGGLRQNENASRYQCKANKVKPQKTSASDSKHNDHDLMEPATRDDENEIIKGVLIPGGILLHVAYTIFRGQMYMPGRGHARNRIIRFDEDPVTFLSFQVVSLGIAGSLFVWFFLANRPKYDQYIHYLLLATVSCSIAGLLILIFEMIVWALQV